MLKQVVLAHFEPVLTEFSPFHHMYAPLCALRTYLRAVWWSHLELGEGCRLEDIYIYIYIYIYIFLSVYFFRCLAGFCDGSPPATRRRGGYRETLAGGQPGPTRAAPPAAFGVAARGGGSCGGCGSGGRPQRGTDQPDDAADSGQVRACDMRATCIHSVLRSVLRSVEREKGRGGRGGQGGRRGTKAAGGCSATCVPQAQGPEHQGAAR